MFHFPGSASSTNFWIHYNIDIMNLVLLQEIQMHIDESLANLTRACYNFRKTLVSFRRTMTAIYVLLAVLILAGTFDLGVELGKRMCH